MHALAAIFAILVLLGFSRAEPYCYDAPGFIYGGMAVCTMEQEPRIIDMVCDRGDVACTVYPCERCPEGHHYEFVCDLPKRELAADTWRCDLTLDDFSTTVHWFGGDIEVQDVDYEALNESESHA